MIFFCKFINKTNKKQKKGRSRRKKEKHKELKTAYINKQ